MHASHSNAEHINRGIIFMILAVFCFSLMDVAMKHLADHLSTFQVSFFRGATSLPFILLWLLFSRRLHRIRPVRVKLHLVRAVLTIGFLTMTVVTLRELPLANAYAIFFVAPLLITLLSVPLLKEHVGIHRYGAVVVGFIGVLIMLNPNAMGFLSLGVIAGLLATLGYSLGMILVRYMHRTETSESLMFFFLLAITIGCGIVALFDWQSLQLADIKWLVLLGISGAIAQYLLTEAYRQAPPSVLSSFEYTAMIWAIGLGYVFWNELPGLWVVVGVAIVIASGLYISHREAVHKVPVERKLEH